MNEANELATLGGGCFWCLEAVYQRLAGMISVTSGYAGGHEAEPTYRSVSTGRSGHAEVVQLCFDPERLGFSAILDVFFELHDPTQRDAQGADIGPQYRSIILYHDADQQRLAEAKIRELETSNAYSHSIKTQVEPLETFYPAEGYHQDYFDNNRPQPYCQVIISPKLRHLEERFSGLVST